MAVTAKHIEIVRSTKQGLSSMSQESCEAILAVLTRQYERVGVTIVNDLADLEALVATKPDLVFLGMKFVIVNPLLGNRAPKVWLTSYLDKYGIAYTGSGRGSHRLEFYKHLAKERVLYAGLDTSPFCVIIKNQPLTREDIRLTFPLFIKPSSSGGGQGVNSQSVVHNFNELQAKVQSIATELDADSLVEEYLSGREFSVALLKNEVSEQLEVMPIELVAPPDERGYRLLSEKVKSSNVEEAVLITDKVLRSAVTALAIEAFDSIGARDYGRIDIRLDRNGVPHFLEANLLPSLIKGYGSFPKACLMNIELGYEQMILRIVKLGFAHFSVVNDYTSTLNYHHAV